MGIERNEYYSDLYNRLSYDKEFMAAFRNRMKAQGLGMACVSRDLSEIKRWEEAYQTTLEEMLGEDALAKLLSEDPPTITERIRATIHRRIERADREVSE